MSRDIVQNLFLISDLNNIDVQCPDIHNAYHNFNLKERVYFYAGKGLRKYYGNIVVVVRLFYELKGAISAC